MSRRESILSDTPVDTLTYIGKVSEQFANALFQLAPRRGLEPRTCGLTVQLNQQVRETISKNPKELLAPFRPAHCRPNLIRTDPRKKRQIGRKTATKTSCCDISDRTGAEPGPHLTRMRSLGLLQCRMPPGQGGKGHTEVVQKRPQGQAPGAGDGVGITSNAAAPEGPKWLPVCSSVPTWIPFQASGVGFAGFEVSRERLLCGPKRLPGEKSWEAQSTLCGLLLACSLIPDVKLYEYQLSLSLKEIQREGLA